MAVSATNDLEEDVKIVEYTAFGKAAVRVSKLGLGGATLGGDFGPVTDEQVAELIDLALALGINFIDTGKRRE